jgi:hypothetical protein
MPECAINNRENILLAHFNTIKNELILKLGICNGFILRYIRLKDDDNMRNYLFKIPLFRNTSKH